MEPRTGLTPAQRPTEWVSAVVGLIVAGLAWYNDRDTAALVAVATGALPTIITAITSWFDSRKTPQGATYAPPDGQA